MPLLLLLLLFLLYVQNHWSPPLLEWSAAECILITLAGHGCLVLFAAAVACRHRVELRNNPFARGDILSRFSSAKFRHFLLITGYLLGSLYFLGWGWAIQQELSGWAI